MNLKAVEGGKISPKLISESIHDCKSALQAINVLCSLYDIIHYSGHFIT